MPFRCKVGRGARGEERSRQLHPVQQCFLEGAALQCGVCTPGFIVQTEALLRENANPTEDEIRFYLAGNLCRCTGYTKIVDAAMQVIEENRQ